MPEPARPWWRLHWPSWLALVVFGGAFVVANVPAPNNHKLGWFTPLVAFAVVAYVLAIVLLLVGGMLALTG